MLFEILEQLVGIDRGLNFQYCLCNLVVFAIELIHLLLLLVATNFYNGLGLADFHWRLQYFLKAWVAARTSILFVSVSF